MRTLSSYTSAEIEKTVTQPFYVAALGFNTPLLLSSRGTVSIDGNTYVANGFSIAGLAKKKGGVITGTIHLSNHDLVIGGLVFNQGVKNKTFALYIVYGEGPWVAADMHLVADGVMSGVPVVGTTMQITFLSGTIFTNRSPRLIFAPPVFNHCIAPGFVIDWNEEKKVLNGPKEITVKDF